jgi:hypothetical protein
VPVEGHLLLEGSPGEEHTGEPDGDLKLGVAYAGTLGIGGGGVVAPHTLDCSFEGAVIDAFVVDEAVYRAFIAEGRIFVKLGLACAESGAAEEVGNQVAVGLGHEIPAGEF